MVHTMRITWKEAKQKMLLSFLIIPQCSDTFSACSYNCYISEDTKRKHRQNSETKISDQGPEKSSVGRWGKKKKTNSEPLIQKHKG